MIRKMNPKSPKKASAMAPLAAENRGLRDPREAAQQIWSTVHGAVALEMKDLIQTPDPEATYRATLRMVLRGLAPAT
ncbi:MAG TPA: TetR-like C-terminal domain-containing protein [Streptosporangiaceae bacterium]|nr:TetR-like C-terminal domain-containing protein [Streptosporangiaceae bacterium]